MHFYSHLNIFLLAILATQLETKLFTLVVPLNLKEVE